MTIFTKNSSTKMLRTLIIDDEPHIRETLQGLLISFCPLVKVIGQASSVKDGEKEIRQKRPDLVLLDIKMGDGTGFDLLNRFENMDFKIIFVTAWEKYAIQAFGFSAIDYLLKPVNPEKLVEAVERAALTIQSNFNTQLKALRQNLQEAGHAAKKIILRTNENIYLLDVQEIIHCYADGNYTVFETSRGEKIMVSKILKEYDDLLADSGFLRVHRSHLINLKHIRRLSKMDGGAVVMSNGTEVPVSASGKERLLELIEEIER
ncbi:MAG: LytTR family DNA-binding domain-containing protein [Lentimicrobium sp.]|nr:LytTR family DNA-binding domain-containing protein [Lentimicrobium sp.]